MNLLKKIFNFNNLSYLVLAIGMFLLGVAIYQYFFVAEDIPATTPDMMRRLDAIEQKEKGNSGEYYYETDGLPGGVGNIPNSELNNNKQEE